MLSEAPGYRPASDRQIDLSLSRQSGKQHSIDRLRKPLDEERMTAGVSHQAHP
jgi:hypothetical protein